MTNLYEKFSEKEWQLLEARARRVERAAQQVETRHLIDVLTVQLHSESYAIPVNEIRAVYEDISITELPGVPAHIAGIANIRGQLVTVLDLAHILAIGGEKSEKYALLLLDFDEMHAAIRVEQVSEVAQLALDELNTIPGETKPFIQGVLSDGTALLNLQQLVDGSSLLVDQQF
jgi:purine-binding chemotaxis protein CheW